MEQEEWKRKRDVIRHYDGLADVYDSLYSSEQNSKIESALKAVKIRGSDLVLDAGCGTCLLYSRIGCSVKLLVGLDISLGILKVAAERSKRLSEGSPIYLVRADADYMPFQDEVFDKVFAVTLLQNMPNPVLTLNEMSRVSKDDSTTIVTGLKKAFTWEAFTRILSRSGFKFSMVKTSGEVKCYIAICSKKRINKRACTN